MSTSTPISTPADPFPYSLLDLPLPQLYPLILQTLSTSLAALAALNPTLGAPLPREIVNARIKLFEKFQDFLGIYLADYRVDVDAWLGKVEDVMRGGERKESVFEGEMAREWRMVEERGRILRELKGVEGRVRERLRMEWEKCREVEENGGGEGRGMEVEWE